MKLQKIINHGIIFGALVALFAGCAPGKGQLTTTPSTAGVAPALPDQPDQGPADVVAYKPYPPLWEDARPDDGPQWSDYVYNLVKSEGVAESLLPGSQDITDFCPNYKNLSNDQRANFWAVLVSGVVKYESAFNPLNRYQESTMGTDPITGQPVYSEGLLQLSYQDIQGYPFCQFDWSKDKYLSPKDPNKTILNPYINLDCGIRILASQVHRRGRIALSSGVYWSTLKVNGRYNKLPQIEAITKAIPFCQ